jgi:nicotinamidase-related amidase
MTTLPNRPNTALLIVDVQTGVVAKAHDRNAVIANIAAVADKARARGVPVIWVRHENEQLVPGQDAWQIAPELVPAEGEPFVEKRYGDAFEATNLEPLLADLGVGKLLVAGAMTDQCIRSTLHGALARGYDTVLVKDAHTTEDATKWGAPPPEQVIAHTNMYWTYQTAPGRTAGTVATAEVGFAGG